MLIAAIIFGLVALTGLVIGILGWHENEDWRSVGWLMSFVSGILVFITFWLSLHFSIGSQELTGYIYSYSYRVGYITAHIRFSQNAGTDAQPEFCVKTDSKAGRAIKKYVGSGTKVKVDIPPYFYFANNPFACGTTNMTIQETK